MEHNRTLLSSNRKTRSFRANFEKMLAIVQFNKILLMAAAEFRVIDILEGHLKKIQCLDVSLISKIIVSFSQDLLIVHSLMRDESVLQDHVITAGPLKWKESWRYEIKMPIKNLNMSPIGDFFAISGEQVLSIWTRDGQNNFSYSNAIYYSSENDIKVLAAVIKQKELGSIIQQEVTKDGRLIIVLESKAKYLRIFYQDNIVEKKIEKKKEDETQAPFDWRSLNKNQDSRYRQKEEKNVVLADNPYADVDNMDSYNLNDGRGDKKLSTQDLAEYLLPNHRNQIEYFKILHHDVYESEKRNLPNVILTITNKNEIFLWQENQMISDMLFVCIHTFRGYQNTPYLDASFLEFPPINPKRYVELKSDISKLFDTSRDQTLRGKKEENGYGIYQENYHETTLDWILVLNDIHLEIYKLEGLRNFPTKCTTMSQQMKLQLGYNPKVKSNDNWKIDKVVILKRKTIEKVIIHQQLPFVAHNMNNTELYFYIDEQSKNQIIKRPDMKFMGSYTVFHQTKQHIRIDESLRIIQAKWVKNLCQMVVHFSNNSLALLSSATQIRILAHQKYPEEYLKLWEEKRSQIAEKWEALYEIKFDDGIDAEQIVDFEILDTVILEDGFKIIIAIFTNKNQYLVYETTTIFDEHLKTHSKTSLVYNKYTTDNLIKLLGSCNSFENDSKTVMALITEIDPNSQPEKLQKQEQIQDSAPSQPAKIAAYDPYGYGDDDDSESSEEVDIFGNSTKKDKYKPLKKKQEQVVVKQPEEPLKHQLLLKMIQFDEKSHSQKQYQELWRVELPMSFKHKEYKCRYNTEFISFMINDGPSNDLYIYLYDLTSNKYIGFVNTTEITGYKQEISQIDYVLTKGSAKGSITLYSQDSLYLISQSARDGQPGKWSLIRKYENVVNIEKSQIRTSQIYESPWRRLIIVINNHHLDIKDKFIEYRDDLQKTEQNTPGLISEFLDFDLEQIITEIQELQIQKTSQGQGSKKQETSQSLFDDYYGGFGEPKKEEKPNEKKDEKEQTNQQLEIQFENCYKDMIVSIRTFGKDKLGLDDDQKREYIEFAKRFKQLYKKEFFSDDLTSILLRKVFFETEEVELEEVDKKQQDKMSASPFNVMNFIQQLRTQPAVSKANISLLNQWTSLEAALALHSQNQDVIVNELQNRFDFDNNLNYEMMKKLCIPVWLKDIPKLKLLVEKVAKCEYKNAGDDFNKSSRAEKTALWYVLIGKKNMLCTLYKTEAQQKKVYEFLLQDFSLPKIKTMASKNAMALMSKKNHILACAFFLLAGNIKDALQVALDRLSDPVLAVLIVRLMDEENSQLLMDVYQKHYVDRGEKMGDPYLQNIGRWQRKEFLKSVNLFSLDTSKQNNIQYILKSDAHDFNLFYSTKQKEQIIKQEEATEYVPFLSGYDYYALDFIKELKKNTNVKRQIQKTYNASSNFDGGGGDSIFDDFYGGPSKTQNQQKSQVDQSPVENKLIIDESKILEIVSFETSQRGYSLVSLISLTENSEFIQKMDKKYKQLLANALLTDVIQSLMHGEYGQISKLSKSIELLAEKLEIDKKESKEFIRKQLKHIENLNLIIGYLIDEGKEGVMYKVEQEALKQMNFINSMADFPFITDGGYMDKRGFNIPKMVDFLENLVESYMLVDYQKSIATPRQSTFVQQKSKTQKKSAFDFADEDEDNNQMDEHKGQVEPKMMDIHHNNLPRKLTALHADFEVQLQDASTKIRTTLIIYISLVQLCFISKKFGMVKSLLYDIRTILSKKITEGNFNSQEINLQKLKTKIQKFKYQLLKNDQDHSQQEDLQYQQVGAAFDKPTKEQEEQLKQKNKVNQFILLWLRFIISHNMFQLVDYQFEKSQIRSLIDLRPSIIKTRPLNEAIEIILNPRLMSGEMLKKFNNMHRILENVTTYYFENLLNLQEREIIVNELKKIQGSKFEQIETENLDLSKLFNNETKFSQFAQYFDLGGFIKHLRDHELSLIYHTNNDYSVKTIQRTQELFESGIDIFRMKNESVGGFAFDNCDMDLVSLAMQNKGTREIPVRKALLYRNRLNKGHQVLDEEYNTWQECLKRYDKVSQEHENLKASNEPIIAIVDKLYSYKTVNYTKKLRRKRGTLLLDYEMNPPETWSGLRSNEYLKPRTAYDISHEEYAACVDSHPYLPLYVTGNSKGYMSLWAFNQNEDRALDHWETEHQLDPKNINQKKATLKKIQFSNYGDKVVSLNMEGSIYMHKVDNQESSRVQPIYQLKKQKELKYNDFVILNYDSVLSMTSLKPRHLWIYDTLVASRHGLVMESNNGGNIMQALRKRNQIMMFNEKPGQMNILDLKMNKLVASIQLHSDEVTSVTMNETENTLVAGFRDGIVKIYNADKEYELREQFMAFTTSSNKKGSVTQVKFHPTNGALFGSSITGNFKILRTKL
eukprot:403360465